MSAERDGIFDFDHLDSWDMATRSDEQNSHVVTCPVEADASLAASAETVEDSVPVHFVLPTNFPKNQSSPAERFKPRSLSREQVIDVYDALVRGYSRGDFQMKLHARWFATDDEAERYQVQAELCLDVQLPVIAEFGFEASKQGLWDYMASYFEAGFQNDEILTEIWKEVNWWINPSIQAAEQTPSSCIHPTALRYLTLRSKRLKTTLHVPKLTNLSSSFVSQYSYEATLASKSSVLAPKYQVKFTKLESGAAVKGVDSCRAALAGAHQQLYQDMFPNLLPEAWCRFLGCTTSIRNEIRSGATVMHIERQDNRQVVGYILCNQMSGTSSAVPGGGNYFCCMIQQISVLPDHRCQGLGKRLLTSALDHLDAKYPSSAGKCRLNVVERNVAAVDWYRRLGFVVFASSAANVEGCPVKMVSMQRGPGILRM